MLEFSGLKKCERDLLQGIHRGKDLTKTIREFAATAYQQGFKEGLLESTNSWWNQMDKDKAYIASCSATDESDNAKNWNPI